MTFPTQTPPPVFHTPTGLHPATDHRQEGQANTQSFGRRINNFFANLHMPPGSGEVHAAWKSLSNFFKGIFDRSVQTVNYVSKYIGDILPPYLMRAGAGSITGFIVGAFTPVGPLWGTVSGLLLATGWQLCVECNTDRDKPKM